MLIAVKVNEWHRRMKDEPIGRDLMDFEIRNDSASDIREVSAEMVRKSLFSTVFGGASTVIYQLLPSLKKEWEEAQNIVALPLEGGRPTIAPGGKFHQMLNNYQMGSIYKLEVTFVDANSYGWKITIVNGGQGQRRNDLKQIKYYRGLWERDSGYRRTPFQLLGHWQTNAKLAWWMIWHPAKKRKSEN